MKYKRKRKLREWGTSEELDLWSVYVSSAPHPAPSLQPYKCTTSYLWREERYSVCCWITRWVMIIKCHTLVFTSPATPHSDNEFDLQWFGYTAAEPASICMGQELILSNSIRGSVDISGGQAIFIAWQWSYQVYFGPFPTVMQIESDTSEWPCTWPSPLCQCDPNKQGWITIKTEHAGHFFSSPYLHVAADRSGVCSTVDPCGK